MLILTISEADLETVRYERFHYPCAIVQKRLHTLYMIACSDLSYGSIANLVGIHRDTLTDFIRYYQQGGLARIYQVGYGTNRSALEQYNESLLSHFEKHPVHTINQARSVIKELTGLERSPTQVRAWMKRHGLSYRKTGQIPAKADKSEQELFVQQELNPLIEMAKEQEIHLLFLDAAHFVMGVYLCYLWAVKRIFVKSSAGRKRYNVLGAVNAITKQIHTFTNNSYINANCICDFFEQLRSVYTDAKPIYIILDNARYQKCQLVRYVAWQFHIQLVYLPPYSPNLNIIERLWKWTKKKALYAKFHNDFELFKNAIDHTIQTANGIAKSEMQTLLTLNFQTF